MDFIEKIESEENELHRLKLDNTILIFKMNGIFRENDIKRMRMNIINQLNQGVVIIDEKVDLQVILMKGSEK